MFLSSTCEKQKCLCVSALRCNPVKMLQLAQSPTVQGELWQ